MMYDKVRFLESVLRESPHDKIDGEKHYLFSETEIKSMVDVLKKQSIIIEKLQK
jgi:hypothetical protein